MTTGRNPWVGLRPFDEIDRALFFGRQRSVTVLNNLAETLPIVIVYAPSGTGKSSILNAGLIPLLLKHHRIVRLDAESAVAHLKSMLEEASANGTSRPDAPVFSRVIAVFDQFEELLNTTADTELIFDLMASCVRKNLDSQCIILSIREDYLGALEPLMQRLPGLMDAGYRVPDLDLKSFGDAVVGPLRAIEAEEVLDSDLFDRVMADLAGVDINGPSSRGVRIEPGYFQIVWSTLWAGRSDNGQLTLENYNRLGGARGIIEGFVAQTLSNLDPIEAELFWQAAQHMILPTGAKIPVTIADLLALVWPKLHGERPDPRDPVDGDFAPNRSVFEGNSLPAYWRSGRRPEHNWVARLVPDEQALRAYLFSIVSKLTRTESPVLKRVVRGGRQEYELVHDLLGSIILEWRSTFEDARNVQREHFLENAQDESRACVMRYLGLDPHISKWSPRLLRRLAHGNTLATLLVETETSLNAILEPESSVDAGLDGLVSEASVHVLTLNSILDLGLSRTTQASHIKTILSLHEDVTDRLISGSRSGPRRGEMQRALSDWLLISGPRSNPALPHRHPVPMLIGGLAYGLGTSALSYLLMNWLFGWASIPYGRTSLAILALLVSGVAFAQMLSSSRASVSEALLSYFIPLRKAWRSGAKMEGQSGGSTGARMGFFAMAAGCTAPLPMLYVYLLVHMTSWVFGAIGQNPVAGFHYGVLLWGVLGIVGLAVAQEVLD